MAALRACALIALAQLVPSASADNGALVQSRVDLHRQEPTAEELVASCANQLPIETIPADVSKANTKKIADSVVAAFQDPSFVRIAYQAVTNQTNLWRLFKQVTTKRVANLDNIKANKTKSPEQVLDKLYGFWSRHGEDFARALATEAGIREVVNEALPEGYLRELHPSKAAGPVGVYNTSFQYLSNTVDDMVDGLLEGVTPDSKLLCDRVGIMMTNLSSAYFTLPMAIKSKYNPALESAVKSFAPEGAATLLKFLDATYSTTSEVSMVFQDLVHSLKESNSNLLQQRFECQPI